MWVAFRAVLAVCIAGAVRPANEEAARGAAEGLLIAHAPDPSKSEPEGFWPQRKQEVKTVARFWALLGILGLTGYGASFLKNERSPDLSRYLKLAALKLQKEKILWQLICAASLFGLADLLAQRVPSYHEKSNLNDGYKLGGWDWRYTATVVICACLFQVAALGYFYDYCDARFGQAGTWQAVAVKMLKMQVAFVLGYLPLAVFFFALLVCFIFRSFADSTDNCGPSALVGSPWNLGSSFGAAAVLWPGDYLHSMIFWPPSHLVNYVLIQRWSPNFRPIFDGVVVLAWNTYVLAGGAVREAVGPTLFGAAPGPSEKVQASVDCAKHSFGAILRWMGEKLRQVAVKEGCVRAWHGFCWATEAGWKWFKHGCNLFRQHLFASVKFLVQTLLWLLATVFYSFAYIFLLALTGVRVTLYWALAIIKGSVMIFFTIADFVKKCMVVFYFLPDVSSLGSGCFYCVLWPKDGQWPKQVLGPRPAFSQWVSPFCPHCQ
ncbi:unnamed protein product [Effrenium voratum]|nr:unnamed protein product [Effrenium voratum]